jgi:hypothetical protein
MSFSRNIDRAQLISVRRSSAIEYLESRRKTEKKHGLAYHYCQYNSEDTRDPPIIIRTILAQLISDFRDPVILFNHETIKTLFLNMSRGQGPPNGTKQLTQLIKDISTLYHQVTIVIDGLDECHKHLRRSLLQFITSINNSENTARALVLSRPEPDIMDELKFFPYYFSRRRKNQFQTGHGDFHRE